VLLIEISGCIAARDPYVDEEDDPFLSDDFDATPLVPGAIAAITALSEERFGDKVFLMSVARAQVQAKISRWMTKRDFYALTGVSRGTQISKPQPPSPKPQTQQGEAAPPHRSCELRFTANSTLD